MKKRTWLLIVIISISFGFLGAWIYQSASKTFIDKDILEIYFSWPPVIFILVLLFIFLFYSQIAHRLEKGGIRIKWGDKEIYLAEFQEIFEQDIGSNIDERIELAIDEDKVTIRDTMTDIESIKYHLTNSRFKWRTLKTLIKRTGLDSEKIEDIVKKNKEIFIRRRNRDDEIIYKLRN